MTTPRPEMTDEQRERIEFDLALFGNAYMRVENERVVEVLPAFVKTPENARRLGFRVVTAP